MQGPERPIWFAGDLADPWVAAIADALPPDARRIDGGDELAWPIDGPAPRTIVLHRGLLTAAEAQSLARLRARCERPPRVVLCVGPHARYADIERWSRIVDVVLPEATAVAVVLRHAIAPELRPARVAGPRSRLIVVSGLHDLRLALVETCRSGGYAAEAVRDWPEAPPEAVAVWDVPVLEPGWETSLLRHPRPGPVVALLGFSDRATVRTLRDLGVAACLESTCEMDDLLGTLDRVIGARVRAEPAHDLPPAPRSRPSATLPDVAERGSRF